MEIHQGNSKIEASGEKHVVVVSRKWHEPKIGAYVNSEEVGVYISLADFMLALAKEMDKPSLFTTKVKMQANMMAAYLRVVDGLKEHSSHAIS